MLILLTYRLIRAFLIILCHQARPVAHLCKQPTCLIGMIRLQQGTCIDILHHVLIHRLNKFYSCLLPECHILSMLSLQHITTHEQQRMLTTQTRCQLSFCIGTYLVDNTIALSQIFLRRIIPSIGDYLRCTIQIAFQVVHIAHHQRITLTVCEVANLLGIEIIQILVRTQIRFPVV